MHIHICFDWFFLIGQQNNSNETSKLYLTRKIKRHLNSNSEKRFFKLISKRCKIEFNSYRSQETN